jgi:hypothetical protein
VQAVRLSGPFGLGTRTPSSARTPPVPAATVESRS